MRWRWGCGLWCQREEDGFGEGRAPLSEVVCGPDVERGLPLDASWLDGAEYALKGFVPLSVVDVERRCASLSGVCVPEVVFGVCDAVLWEVAGPVVEGGLRVVVEGEDVGAPFDVDRITDAIAVEVLEAVTAAHSDGVELVSVAVAVAFWDVLASAGVDGSGPVAHAALVEVSVALSVADSVAIAVKQALSVAVIALRGVGA